MRSSTALHGIASVQWTADDEPDALRCAAPFASAEQAGRQVREQQTEERAAQMQRNEMQCHTMHITHSDHGEGNDEQPDNGPLRPDRLPRIAVDLIGLPVGSLPPPSHHHRSHTLLPPPTSPRSTAPPSHSGPAHFAHSAG